MACSELTPRTSLVARHRHLVRPLDALVLRQAAQGLVGPTAGDSLPPGGGLHSGVPMEAAGTASHKAGVRCQEPGQCWLLGPIHRKLRRETAPVSRAEASGVKWGKFPVADDAGCLGPAWFHEMTLLRADVKGAPGQPQWWDRKDPEDGRDWGGRVDSGWGLTH